MTKNTGYQIIDFKNIDFYNGATIPGLFESISKSNGKPLYLANIKYNGSKISDHFSASVLDDPLNKSLLICTGGSYTFFIVNENDEIHKD